MAKGLNTEGSAGKDAATVALSQNNKKSKKLTKLRKKFMNVMKTPQDSGVNTVMSFEDYQRSKKGSTVTSHDGGDTKDRVREEDEIKINDE